MGYLSLVMDSSGYLGIGDFVESYAEYCISGL